MFAKSYSLCIDVLEERVQPGFTISMGLDLSLLSGSIVGQSLVFSTMPADASVADRVTTQGVSEGETATTNNSEVTVNPSPAAALELPDTQNLMNLQTNHDLALAPSLTLSQQSSTNLGDNGVHAMIPPNALFYGGDLDGRAALSNEHNTLVTDSSVWDNFYVTDDTGDGQGWQITTLFNRSVQSRGETADSCNWAIRTGISTGNGGNIAVTANGGLASGTDSSTYTPTGNSNRGLPEYEIVVDISDHPIQLLPGKYYLNVQPIGSQRGQWFENSATNGGPTSIGQQDPNDSWFNSSYFGYNWVEAWHIWGSGIWNFSSGVCGESL
jgi:hypothetical protein